MIEEYTTEVFNYFWEHIAPKMNMRQSDYYLYSQRCNTYRALSSSNGRLRINDFICNIYNIPCQLDNINIRLYVKINQIHSKKYICLYYYEYGRCTLFYQSWRKD